MIKNISKIKKRKKKGVSPVIATIFLVALVLVLAGIVFLLFKQFVGEACTKFGNQNVEMVCKDDVNLEASYNNGKLSLENNGNAPIYELKVRKIKESGSSDTVEITKDTKPGEWDEAGLNKGNTAEVTLDGMEDIKEIEIVPVLLSECDDNEVKKACEHPNSITNKKIG